MRRTTSIALPIVLGACEPPAEPHEPEAVPLVDVTSFVDVPIDADAFAQHRPMELSCDEPGWVYEPLGGAPALEIDTGKCPYVTVGQSTLQDVQEGDQLLVRLFHFELTAPEPAVAHLAVALEGTVLWEIEVPIPSPSTLVVERIPLVEDAEAGADLQFHARNHGFNTYSLLEISRER